VYSLLKKNNVEISNDLKQALMELLCFYNCEEPLEEDMIEERWFRQNQRLKERNRKTWKDNDTAEQLYYEIEPKTPQTYACIIRGMCKYYQVEKAYAIFQDCLANNIKLDVDCFNSILNVVRFVKESADLRWALMLDLLKTMKEKGISPNLGTLNSCLNSISEMGTKNAKDYAIQIMTEFKNIGIEPSLASYYHILHTFCKDRGPVSHVLVDILNEIEGKEFEMRDIKDTMFFVQAMDVCRNHLYDLNLAKRVDAFLHLGENYNLIGDSYKESIYYRNYFTLLVQAEPFEKFMADYYHILVPHVYIPEPSVMEEILKAVEVTGAIDNIPLLWSHMICFEQISRDNLLALIVRIMLQNKPDLTIKTQENLKETFSHIAWDVWSKIEEKNELRSKPVVWTGKLLGDILRIICTSEDIDRASVIMEKLLNDQQKILGEPDYVAMEDYVQLCIIKKQPSRAIQCLQYCTEIGFNESKNLAKTICKGFTLDENHTRRVVRYVGESVLQELENEMQEEAAKNVTQ
jgi:pentatricopeptide repeat domain-containing protein 3